MRKKDDGASPKAPTEQGKESNATELLRLTRDGYNLLPLPYGRKEPPPKDWINATEPYL